MENEVLLMWQGKEAEITRKEQSWYWTVGIIAGGVTIAAIIVGNYLFGVIAVLAGFAVMVAGSRKPQTYTYKLSERGFMVGNDFVPYANISRFAISDHTDPKRLIIETTLLTGTIAASLEHTNHRDVRTILLNNNVEEVESLDTFFEKIAAWMGV